MISSNIAKLITLVEQRQFWIWT